MPSRTGQDGARVGCGWCVAGSFRLQRSLLIAYLSPEKEHGSIFNPVFVSVDPARDSPSRITVYLKDFHPAFTGLVGPYEAVKAMCKAYRVYFSTPPNAKPEDDYLVDHSIFVYLMDPKGQFVEAFGQTVTIDEMLQKVRDEITTWKSETGRSV